MNQSRRLKQGGRIDRTTPLKFEFNGKYYDGYQGDTLASALLANNIHLIARSFKYHRPRGIYSAGVEEPNALLQLHSGAKSEPNTRATLTELTQGLESKSQNAWPSVKFDLMAVNGLFSSVLTAGFYYKTFMWPGSWWMFYEKFIRKAAGMGTGTYLTDKTQYEKAHAHCDVLVIGAGPAGLSAALEAANNGAKVILVDQDFELGGQLLSEGDDDWLSSQVQEIQDHDQITIMTRTTAFGYYDHNVVNLVERVSDHLSSSPDYVPRQRMWTVRAQNVVLATGALERPFVFGNNDIPGIMLASGARTYIRRFGVKPGQAAVLFTNNDSIYEMIGDLLEAGIKIQVIVDSREQPSTEVMLIARQHNIHVRSGQVITSAHGGKHIHSVSINSYDVATNTVSSDAKKINCDLLLMSAGWSPIVHLQSHVGIKPTYSDDLSAFLPGDCPQGQYCAGSVLGHWNTATARQSGVIAGRAAASGSSLQPGSAPRPSNSIRLEPLWEVPSPADKKLKKFVDLQHDVTASDVVQAHTEGYVSVEHMKRYTTLGMATDQGKTSGINGMAIMARQRNMPLPKVGTTTFRPPYTPAAIGAFGGRETGHHFRPERLSPMHDLHVQAGAEITQTGLWQRAWYYPKSGEKIGNAYRREANTVRNSVGITDISTLGKIDVQGPDAAEFLNRIYVNGWAKLAVGKSRYGVMLRDDGYVMDDGTTSRLSEDHFFMTTTTVNAGKVLSHMQFLLEADWPELRVHVSSSTEQWAGMAVAGPKSRELLQSLNSDIAFSQDDFPPMALRCGHIDGIPVRVSRISFSGELAFEVYTPAGFGAALWRLILEDGKEFNLTPYGTEALGTLRIEKGHVAGPELDGRTTLNDLGLGKMASSKKAFVGNVLCNRPGLCQDNRPTLVGLKPINQDDKLLGGTILFPNELNPQGHGQGHVSSVTYSPALGHYIALGFLQGGTTRIGETILAVNALRGEQVAVNVVSPHFYDPEGGRANA